MMETDKFYEESGKTRSICESIAADILEKKETAMAMEFTKQICNLQKKNGVSVKMVEYRKPEMDNGMLFEEYGFSIEGLDFEQHDKEFQDKIEELNCEIDKWRKRLDDVSVHMLDTLKENSDEEARGIIDRHAYNELKCVPIGWEPESDRSISDFLPEKPIQVAEALIAAEVELEMRFPLSPLHERKTRCRIYSVKQLRQIAEHLLVYCNHNEENGDD